MANLYGRMRGSRGEVTRTGTWHIESKLETWNGSIKTTLDNEGNFIVYIGSKSNPTMVVATGNVDTGEVS